MNWTLIGLSLLHFLWQGVLLATAAGIVSWALKGASSHARYLVYCLTMLGMALCPPITAFLLAQASSKADTSLLKPVGSEDLRLLVVLWLVGVGALGLRLIGGMWGMVRLGRSGLLPVSEELQTRFDALAANFRLPLKPRLLLSQKILVPTVVGIFRGTVLLPASAATGMSVPMLEALICHELAHVARFDVLVNGMQSMVEVLLFYHPCVWWISDRIRHERENCCDDAVLRMLNDPPSYVKALAMTAQAVSMPLAIRADGGDLLYRVRRILGQEQPRSTVSPIWAAMFLIAFLLAPIAGQAVLPAARLGNPSVEALTAALPDEFGPSAGWTVIKPQKSADALIVDVSKPLPEIIDAVEAVEARELPPRDWVSGGP